jgi:hypothetical protein
MGYIFLFERLAASVYNVLKKGGTLPATTKAIDVNAYQRLLVSESRLVTRTGTRVESPCTSVSVTFSDNLGKAIL